MKKIVMSALATATIIGSMSTIASANGVTTTTPLLPSKIETVSPFGSNSTQSKIETSIKTPLELLKEQKNLLATRLFSTEFSTLPISEQLTLLNESFSLQDKIHDEYKKSLLSNTVVSDVDSLRESLQNDEIELKKEVVLLEQILLLSRSEKADELVASKEKMKETFTSLKEYRNSAREVKSLIKTKQEAFQVSEIKTLQQITTTSLKENKMKEAIDSLAKIVKLSEGDQDYVTLLEQLLSRDESYLLWNNELIQVEEFAESDNRWHISIEQLEEWMDIERKTDKDKNETMLIKYDEHEVVFDKDGITFDGTFIGNPPVWNKNVSDKQYLDVEFIFELFGYKVDLPTEKKIIKVSKEVYEIEEIDMIPVEDMVNSMLP